MEISKNKSERVKVSSVPKNILIRTKKDFDYNFNIYIIIILSYIRVVTTFLSNLN